MMNDDMDLLRDYAARQSEQAFATLVARHVNLVHSAALRQVRDPELAGEITQTVFIILARKAAALSPKTILSGWLYRTAQFAGRAAQKRERRRQLREQEAYMRTLTDPPPADSSWEQLSPLLDEAMAHLRDQDRNALVLRYFENRSLKEVGGALGVEERAAQKRVARGLEKLRGFLIKRGVVLTTAVIAGAVSANSVQAAPAALAPSVTALALAQGAAAGGSTLTLIKGALKLMAWTKAKLAIVAAVGLMVTTGVTVVIVEQPRLVQGKTEDEWIKSIVYNGDDNQRHLWQSLGPRGVQMLIRALKTRPKDDSEEQMNTNRVIRMNAADLLCALEDNDGEKGYHADKSAVPELIQVVKTEKTDSVRGLELACLEIPIRTMTEEQKAGLFPELLRAMGSPEANVRNNALVALPYYTNEADTVVPLLVKALQDSAPWVRLHAAGALNKVDRQTAAKTDLVRVLVGCLTNQSVANEATFALGDLHREPELAVPALIQSLQSPESYVRGNSAGALARFGGQAQAAVPALQRALEDPDAYVRREAAAALKRINSDAPAQ